MRHTVTPTIRPGDQRGYVGECPELGVTTQALTLDEMAANLREAVALALDGEDLHALGFSEPPTVVVMFELEAVGAWFPPALWRRCRPYFADFCLRDRQPARQPCEAEAFQHRGPTPDADYSATTRAGHGDLPRNSAPGGPRNSLSTQYPELR